MRICLMLSELCRDSDTSEHMVGFLHITGHSAHKQNELSAFMMAGTS